ncbi:MAG: hypothetical protein M3N13_04495, partial [Candidatus Eremiobacteraeota bacterium]|nr:hypothetical protein [Candidatus Eremiobacteraeota bacterium]
MRIALATMSGFAHLSEDDAPLVPAFALRGVRAEPAVWTEESVVWSNYDAVVVRSTWDYHKVPERFAKWLDWVDASSLLINSRELILWNMHKAYLGELADTGVNVVPTTLVRRGEFVNVYDIAESLDADEFVIKPAISASGHRTRVVTASSGAAAEIQSEFEALSASCDVLVQPFLREVFGAGERSLIFINGVYSHAVIRAPLSSAGFGDTLVERPLLSSEREIDFALSALEKLESLPIYARVDVIPLEAGGLALLELELIEPSLFFAHRAHAL